MASRMRFVVPAALLGLATFAASHPACAQIRGGRATPQAHPSHGRQAAPPFTGPTRNGFRHRGERRGLANGLFFYPDYFGDYNEASAPEEPPAQQVVVQQPEQPAAAPVPAKPIEPLVLEERDGQWTRVPIGSELAISEKSQQAGGETSSGVQSPLFGANESSGPPAELPSVVLVFRDGHQEKIANYMIEGNTLYTTADYWSTGSWTRKIPIADLDVPASLKLNDERGARFSLPRGPNQVVVRF
jgi:hypothetical protein